MSLSIEELIINAKKLASRLEDDESTADSLINQSTITHKQMQAMKEYSDDVEKLNKAASQRPQSVLVADLQRESHNLKELQAENNELKCTLGDYQKTIDLIMSKYRQQISQLSTENKVDLSALHNVPQCTKIIMDQYAQINKMRQIMRKAAEADEESYIKDQELISKLMTENKGLRELLNINKMYENYQIVQKEQDSSQTAKPIAQQVGTEESES